MGQGSVGMDVCDRRLCRTHFDWMVAGRPALGVNDLARLKRRQIKGMGSVGSKPFSALNKPLVERRYIHDDDSRVYLAHVRVQSVEIRIPEAAAYEQERHAAVT